MAEIVTDNRKKFQELLRRLFQFESADLDFGIYRILNYKRDIIDRFIEKDLLDAVAKELNFGALAEQSDTAKHLQELGGQIKELLGEDALDGKGNLTDQHRPVLEQKGRVADIARKYVILRGAVHGAKPRQAVEAAIFNHLYTFFSRYYDAGDFMSKRRYSRKEKYAVPYNGEDVYLHWANKDQYYIKTGEYFTDYRSVSRGLTIHFKLQAADVEKDNIKGDKRFFVPMMKKADFDRKDKEVVIPFEYRPLTEQEDIRYGQKNQQEAIIAEVLEYVPKHFAKEDKALSALMAEKSKASEGEPVTCLEHHLRQYTKRNTSDFFIHKDLKGFLERELDFYLKNEVLNVDELEVVGEGRAEAWFQTMRVMKAIGSKIIAFLAQIENFQKKLFEKRKFVIETNYCITMGNVSAEFRGEIADNDAQWVEWKELFHIDEEERNIFTAAAGTRKDCRIAFLKAHPTLVLDTRHFGREFVDRLLDSIEDLDKKTDGLLIKSENFQALNLLVEKYRGQVKCIYIDPPFNTGEDFLYKDNYQDSSWLSLLTNRIITSLALFDGEGNYFLHLDQNAVHYGKFILAPFFKELNELIFNTNATKDEESGLFSYKSFGRKFVRQHDTILHGYNTSQHFVKLWKPNRRDSRLELGQLDLLSRPKKGAPKKLADFLFYVEAYQKGHLLRRDIKIGEEKIYPVGDIWNDIYSFTQSEMRVSENVSFLTQKPEHLVRRVIQSCTTPGDLVLDFFGGSGTTPAVCHKLGRQYIAVEIGRAHV